MAVPCIVVVSPVQLDESDFESCGHPSASAFPSWGPFFAPSTVANRYLDFNGKRRVQTTCIAVRRALQNCFVEYWITSNVGEGPAKMSMTA